MEKVTFLLATKNGHKTKEILDILNDYKKEHGIDLDIEIKTLRDVGYDEEIEEDGDTFEKNALIKARVAADLGYIGLADDSGVAAPALGGAPGVYSARYSGGDDEDNNNKLLSELADKDDRTAYYECAIACVYPSGESFTCSGRTYGHILFERQGSGGFGYDPLFFSDDLGKSFGVASKEEKNSVSHRARAVALFADRFFEKYKK